MSPYGMPSPSRPARPTTIGLAPDRPRPVGSTRVAKPTPSRPAASTAHGEVIVVEDSPEDFRAIQRTLRKLGLEQTVRRFEEGEAFFDYMREGADAGRPLPSLVLLDLNMPGADGREVLVEIEADPRFSGRFPIVVLSTSSSEDDVAFSQAHGAASYMTKPVALAGLEACLGNVRAYLMDGRPLPPRC